MDKEIELKFCPVEKDTVRIKLKAAGYYLVAPEFLMRRIVFFNSDCPDSYGRVREEYGKITMAIKCLKKESIDGMEEAEVEINSVAKGISFMNAVGYQARSNQENYREIWQKDGVEVTLDTWPGLPTAMEIESSEAEKVYAAVEELQMNRDEAMFGSIDITYEKVVGIPRQVICKLSEITFANPPKLIKKTA